MISVSSAQNVPAGRAAFPVRSLLLRASLLCAVALPMAGCSTLENLNPFGPEKYKMEVAADVPAETMYNQGLGRIEKGDPKGAAKKFSDLEKQYAHSEWARKALLMEAYANYQAQEYDDAVSAAQRYYQTYPQSQDAAYSLYIAGMSYYDRVPDISRDQENAEKALQIFTLLVQKFPQSEYVNDSKYKIQVVTDQLAGKEMSVGRFYLQRRNYTAAINRFHIVIAKFQTTRHTEEALERLTEAYLGLGIVNEAQTAAAILGHNFPDSQWYKDAYALLQSKGLEPRESQDSWISKAFHTVAGI
ncbi:outer membrane protein assembly factor BamD [Methylovirgula sp. 4M-Z18]|nr:outer membrane protein assembly factor BamD [Methylovirgula sp. 4M-Z18]